MVHKTSSMPVNSICDALDSVHSSIVSTLQVTAIYISQMLLTYIYIYKIPTGKKVARYMREQTDC